jgi:outer membrane translocation and assembly module TamA
VEIPGTPDGISVFGTENYNYNLRYVKGDGEAPHFGKKFIYAMNKKNNSDRIDFFIDMDTGNKYCRGFSAKGLSVCASFGSQVACQSNWVYNMGGLTSQCWQL